MKYKKGFSIIEILVVIVIIGMALVAILSLTTLSLKASISIKKNTQANNLAQETLEIVRNYRDGTNWNLDDPENKYDGLGILTTGVAYHPEKSSDIPPRWTLIQGEEDVNGFTRKVVFENTLRDATDNIVETGGINDPNTKKAIATVSWQEKEIEIITYFTNWAKQ